MLLDGHKPLHSRILDLVASRLGPGACLVADNAEASPEYSARVRAPGGGQASAPFAEDVELSVRLQPARGGRRSRSCLVSNLHIVSPEETMAMIAEKDADALVVTELYAPTSQEALEELWFSERPSRASVRPTRHPSVPPMGDAEVDPWLRQRSLHLTSLRR